MSDRRQEMKGRSGDNRAKEIRDGRRATGQTRDRKAGRPADMDRREDRLDGNGPESAGNDDGRGDELVIEGRNAVLEAFRSGKTIDKLFVLDGCKDGPIQSIVREARKHDTIINYVVKERLDQLSENGKHQGAGTSW